MWESAERNYKSDTIDTASENRENQERKGRFDVVDLFEELLMKRAELGYRPTLFVSSEKDLECSLIGMFESEGTVVADGEAVPSVESLDELRRRLL
jgi:hypothetical protein